MSFERSFAREHAPTHAPPIVVLPPPGKHSATERLTAPVREHGGVAIDASSQAATTTASALTGTSWLAGVLGFGGLEVESSVIASGDAANDDGSTTAEPASSDDHTDQAGDAAVEEGPVDHGDAMGKAEGPEVTGRARKTPVKITTTTVSRAPGGAPDTRRTVGVGEAVILSASTKGTWSASGGTRSGASSNRFVWTAGDRAGTTTVTFHHGNRTVHTRINVVSPNLLAMKLASRDNIKKGEMGAGMMTNVTVGPASVSFGNVEWLEVPGGPTSRWGYWADHDAPNHHPNPSWLRWNARNTGLMDHAMIRGYAKPWYPGGFTWVIPNRYRVTGKGSGYVFIYTHQVFRITDKQGTVTVTKGGAGVTRSP